MTTRTIWTIRATFEIDVDPAKPATMAAAGDFIAKLQAGSVIAKPDGLTMHVECSEPKIQHRRGE